MVVMVALAQSGSWGGYVSGWKYDRPAQSTRGWGFNDSPTVTVTPAQRQAVVYSQYVAAQNLLSVMALQEQQKANAQRERDAQWAAEQALAAQQQMIIQQQQAAQVQAQMLAQQQAAAAQQQQAALELKRQELDAVAAKLEAEKKDREQRELEAKEQAVAAREAKRLEEARAERETPGPEIHRWVDEGGVIHYSTRPKH